MLLTTTPPSSGQFVAIWTYNSATWSSVFRWNGGFLEEYSKDEDLWDRTAKNYILNDYYADIHFMVL